MIFFPYKKASKPSSASGKRLGRWSYHKVFKRNNVNNNNTKNQEKPWTVNILVYKNYIYTCPIFIYPKQASGGQVFTTKFCEI